MVNSIILDDVYAYFPVAEGTVKAVDGVSVSFEHGCFTAVIGESGCGKSVLGQAILGILPAYVQKQGRIMYMNSNLLQSAPKDYYGKAMGIIPQNPSESLNPIRTIEKQMLDVVCDMDKVEALAKLRKSLSYFGLEDVDKVLAAYPFELSGGMQQRVLCAISLLKTPEWILADEPTKGLDAETAAVVYDNLAKFKENENLGMVIITHDIALARRLCDKIAVMYAGQILEYGKDVLDKPKHPYTQAFVAALPENGFQPLEGTAPSPKDDMQGCKFAPRCKQCSERCLRERPKEYMAGDTMVRCFIYAEG